VARVERRAYVGDQVFVEGQTVDIIQIEARLLSWRIGGSADGCLIVLAVIALLVLVILAGQCE